MKKVLVTGGAGFIGSHVVEALVHEHYDVVVVDDLSTGNPRNVPSNVRLYNLAVESPGLADVFERERPSFVIHQAAQASVQGSMRDPVRDAHVNILGTVNLLSLCARYSVEKIIYASSAAVYGNPASLPLRETDPVNPVSFYALSKYTAEQYIKQFAKTHGLKYVILRYSNVYGPRQNLSGEAGVVSIFIDRLLKQQPIEIYGDGNQTRDFVFVRDVARANVSALNFGDNSVVNISSNDQVTINMLTSILAELTNSRTEPLYLPRRPGDIQHSQLANVLAMETLNWQPLYSLWDGLRETVDFFAKTSVNVG